MILAVCFPKEVAVCKYLLPSTSSFCTYWGKYGNIYKYHEVCCSDGSLDCKQLSNHTTQPTVTITALVTVRTTPAPDCTWGTDKWNSTLTSLWYSSFCMKNEGVRALTRPGREDTRGHPGSHSVHVRSYWYISDTTSVRLKTVCILHTPV